MKKENISQPNRPLSLNFTTTTLRRAILARRRNTRLQAIKELFVMKNKYSLLKQPIGAAMVLAMVALGSVSVYAVANWFGGIVNVTSDTSIMTVDLSGCQGRNLPPGIDENTDRRNVKFKITGEPHISNQDLQRKLLADCEYQTIITLYRQNYGVTASDVSVVKSVDIVSRTVVLEVMFGGKTFDKTMSLAPGVAVYERGKAADPTGLKAGDYIMTAFDLPKSPLLETENPFDQEITVKSIFKTQYDLREVIQDGKSLYGAPNNIMPLEQYEELQRKNRN